MLNMACYGIAMKHVKDLSGHTCNCFGKRDEGALRINTLILADSYTVTAAAYYFSNTG